MAKYPYVVKCNGEYYEAGEEVPDMEDMAEGEGSLPFSDNEIELEEDSAGKTYTKSDIQRMNKAELIEMAKNTGVEGAEDMTRAELAEYMLSVFGL